MSWHFLTTKSHLLDAIRKTGTRCGEEVHSMCFCGDTQKGTKKRWIYSNNDLYCSEINLSLKAQLKGA